jgi:putative ABC transport system permease protein
METLLKDLRYGFRSLIKHPSFTAIVIITLALGIGASTAIFSVVNSVVLRRLPYTDADRIVAIPELNAEGKRGQITAANFYDWRQQNTVFEHLAAIRSTSRKRLQISFPSSISNRSTEGCSSPKTNKRVMPLLPF